MPSNANVIQMNKERNRMSTTLDLDAVNAVLAASRSKGGYDEELLDFVKSGDIGREIPVGEKKPASMKASFVQAKARQSKLGEHFQDAQNVEIRIVEGKLYLLRPDLAAANAPAE